MFQVIRLILEVGNLLLQGDDFVAIARKHGFKERRQQANALAYLGHVLLQGFDR